MTATPTPQRFNPLGQPVGFELPGWTPPAFPPHATLQGRYCRIEPLNTARHARDLFDSQADDPDGARWTYSSYGPYAELSDFERWCEGAQTSRDPQFYAIIDAASGRALGSCAYNLPSRAAATRFGFTCEGLFRQAVVNKGRNRDTTWFAIIDGDWNGGHSDAYRRWLDPANFDAAAAQKLRLSELTAPFVHKENP